MSVRLARAHIDVVALPAGSHPKSTTHCSRGTPGNWPKNVAGPVPDRAYCLINDTAQLGADTAPVATLSAVAQNE
jgi:hypothetical protein